jgi:hypothetical protein
MSIVIVLPKTTRERAAMLAALCAAARLVPVPEGVVDLVLDLPLSDETRHNVQTFRDEVNAIRSDLERGNNFASN